MSDKIIKVMFTGDSITDVGRGRPVGQFSTLGGSYVSNLYVQTIVKNPLAKLSFYNSATSGDTSASLLNRYDAEVLSYNPDWIFIMIGINDCWRFETSRLSPEILVTPEQHREYLETMINKNISAGIKTVLVSPYFLEQNRKDPMRVMCDELNTIQRELAKKYSLYYIDVQSDMDKYVQTVNTTYTLSMDRVHPNAYGKQIITNTIAESDCYKELLSLC